MPLGELPIMLVGQRSRHRIGSFRLHCPTREADAVALFAASAGAASYMSGGVCLVKRLEIRLRNDEVIYPGGIPGRSLIDLLGGGFFFGGGGGDEGRAKNRL